MYAWRPSKCPEPLQPLWWTKHDDYLKTNRWQFHSGTNSVPMLMLKKPSKDRALRLWTVVNTHERNKNTCKLASPLPDIETILCNVVTHPYCTLLDGKDAYEQIRVTPEDVPKTLFTTPDGTMVSHVMQIGDCNADAMYQSLMNHIFAAYIGVFMDIYLDDIVIYSDTAKEHVKHVKMVIDTLRTNKFYLSEHKLQFFMEELRILGHVIDHEGIQMDPNKVDKIQNWKTPTRKELLTSFISAVRYLAPGCEGVQIPLGVLSKRAAKGTPWDWTPTDQQAFIQVKHIVSMWRYTHQKTLDYSPGSAPINVSCDTSFTGTSGVLWQGETMESGTVVAFWSGKFNPAQQNYPVHEQELLVIVECLRRFKHLLPGTQFRVFTDHKGLEWIKTEQKLLPWQAQWLETISDFDFEIVHIPGAVNVLADALS